MILYDYSVWSTWQVSQVRDYAMRLSAWFGLDGSQQEYLSERMAERVGIWEFKADRRLLYPKNSEPGLIAELREVGFDDAAIFQFNKQLNRPWRGPKERSSRQSTRLRTLGRGLTRRVISEPISINAAERADQHRLQKYKGKTPFRHLGSRIDHLATNCFWRANCYPFELGEWILGDGATIPYQGLVWYALELERAFKNACAQEELGNTEGAMAHAFRAGGLWTELQMVLRRGELFEKLEAVNIAQRDAARARVKVSMEARRTAYWSFRTDGHKRVEAGRLAAADLGLASETSIRQAFPNRKYPTD